MQPRLATRPHWQPQVANAPSLQTSALLGDAKESLASTPSLSQLLAQERIIRFNVNLTVITQDVKATLFVSQLLYWTQHGQSVLENGGWIFKTREQWEHETGLSRAEQERARALLVDLGLIAEARVGSPARNCYRIVPEALGRALAHVMRREARQLSLFDLRTPAGETQVLLGRHLAYYCAFASLTESITNAVMLSKCLQLQQTVNKAQNERLKAQHTFVTEIPWDQDWFRLAPRQVQTETGLSPTQQKRCMQKLCQLSLLEEAQDQRGYGFVRVQVNTLFGKLTDHLLSKLVKDKEVNFSNSVELVTVTNYSVSESKNAVQTIRIPRGNKNYSKLEQFGTVPNYSKTVQLATVASFSRMAKFGTVPNFAKTAQINGTNKNSPSSSAERANPVGEFLHPSRRLLTPQMASFEGGRWRVFDPLHVRGRRITDTKLQIQELQQQLQPAPSSYPQSDKKSPTANASVVVVPADVSNKEIQLIWPNGLNAIQQQACQKLLRGQAVPTNRHQLLIDELAGFIQTGRVNNPVAYFSKLIRLDIESGATGLVLSHAHEIQEIRLAKAVHEDRLAQSIASLEVESKAKKLADQNAPSEIHEALDPSVNPSRLLAELRQKIGLPPRASSTGLPSQGNSVSSTSIPNILSN